jgi:hypothetical protein
VKLPRQNLQRRHYDEDYVAERRYAPFFAEATTNSLFAKEKQEGKKSLKK